VKPPLGREERTLRWKGRIFWSGCWKRAISGVPSTRSDATRAPQESTG
jgi:hypothetical protein